MKTKIITLLLSSTLIFSVITGCGNSVTDNSVSETQTQDTAATSSSESSVTTNTPMADNEKSSPASFDELISSLCAGQSYTYAPIYEGDNALLVTSYIFDDFEGHLATHEATIFIEKDNSIEKVTTVQSSGTAYPIAITDDNSLIISKRNSVAKGYVSKDTGKFIITEESNIDYLASEEGIYHNYKDGVTAIKEDSSLYDELLQNYQDSEILSFTKAGVSSDGAPQFTGAVYAAYKGDNQYDVSSYYIFDSETTGSTMTPDGISGLPFTYEISGEDITFHFASEDDQTVTKFSWESGVFPTLTPSDDSEITYLSCLNNCDAKTFDVTKYYDNDNNLYMAVKEFDETSLTGDLYHNERINAKYVDEATEGDNLYSINGTQFTAVSFEDVNKEIEYATDEEFKKDVVGKSRFDGFLVKNSDDDFYYALEKEEYAEEYDVVPMLNEGHVRKLLEENVTFTIKENCEITLQKFVNDGDFDNLESEYIIGRELDWDSYPNWSENAKEYYLTNDMLVAISVIDGELYNILQIYVP